VFTPEGNILFFKPKETLKIPLLGSQEMQSITSFRAGSCHFFDQHAEHFKRLTGKHYGSVGHTEMYKLLVEKAGYGKDAVLAGMLDRMKQANKVEHTAWHQGNAADHLADVLKKCGFRPSKKELDVVITQFPKLPKKP
jgi:hypothetical protein